jgi:hypothetical protein
MTCIYGRERCAFLCWVPVARRMLPPRPERAIQLAVKRNRQLEASRQGTAAASSGRPGSGGFFPRLDVIEGSITRTNPR